MPVLLREDSPEVDAASWAVATTPAAPETMSLQLQTSPHSALLSTSPQLPASCTLVLFYRPRRLTEHPPASAILSGPQPGPAVTAQQSSPHLPPQLARAGSSTCPRRRTCSHSCWAWARPDFHATARLPTTTHSCLDREPFPAFPVLWLTPTRYL